MSRARFGGPVNPENTRHGEPGAVFKARWIRKTQGTVSRARLFLQRGMCGITRKNILQTSKTLPKRAFLHSKIEKHRVSRCFGKWKRPKRAFRTRFLHTHFLKTRVSRCFVRVDPPETCERLTFSFCAFLKTPRFAMFREGGPR